MPDKSKYDFPLRSAAKALGVSPSSYLRLVCAQAAEPGASAMSERRWQVFVVRCASCEKTLMTTPLIGAVEIKQFEDHVRSCARHDPLPESPTLGEVMRRVRVGVVDPA